MQAPRKYFFRLYYDFPAAVNRFLESGRKRSAEGDSKLPFSAFLDPEQIVLRSRLGQREIKRLLRVRAA